MKISKKKLIKSLEIFIILVIIIFIYFNNYNAKRDSFYVILTFWVNGIIIIINIVADQSDYSLNKIFWYFNFFFFFIAPLFQYLSDYVMWDYRITDNTYFKTNICVLMCYLTYTFSRILLFKKNEKKININNEYNINDKTKQKNHFIYSHTILVILLILSIISFLFLVFNISFKGLFIRDLNSINIGDNTISIILENFFRSIPVYSIVYSIYYYNKNKKGILYIAIELIILVMVNFPTSITRYWIGLVYIGLALILFTKRIRDRKFDVVLIIIFTVIFPIFQLFKWYSFSDLLGSLDISERLHDLYNSVDFDAYSILARTIDFVSKNGLQYGHQILATIFFIVPRAIWSTKPYPTGQFIAISDNQYFTNISCPFFAEGYIDFGIIGSLIYTCILCYIIYKIDLSFWNNKYKNNGVILKDFYYPFLYGILVFLLRGSLQPVVVYAFTFLIFIFIIKRMCFKGRKEK